MLRIVRYTMYLRYTIGRKKEYIKFKIKYEIFFKNVLNFFPLSFPCN